MKDPRGTTAGGSTPVFHSGKQASVLPQESSSPIGRGTTVSAGSPETALQGWVQSVTTWGKGYILGCKVSFFQDIVGLIMVMETWDNREINV